jgi:hypothetical protein
MVGGDQGKLTLSNIPAEMNGWKVYCAYRNNVGTTNTGSAAITVNGAQGGTVTPAGGTATPALEPGFEGTWAEEGAGKCQLTFTNIGEGRDRVDIFWSSSAAERSVWTMTADVVRRDTMEYHDGQYWVEQYETDGSYTVSNKRTGDSGSFYFNEQNKLVWHDNYTGDDTILVRVR